MWTVIITLACLLGVGLGQLSFGERKLFKNLHNEYRKATADKYQASNMKQLKWNSNLQAVAQQVADRCLFEHSKLGYGENLFKTSGSDRTLAISGALRSWQKEEPYYDYNTGRCKTDSNGEKLVCGHYTQVNWATSEKLGCGMKSCPNPNKPGAYFLLVVCEYDPRGNVLLKDIGMRAYEKGTVCGKCADYGKYWQCENSLCKKIYTTRTINDVIRRLLDVADDVDFDDEDNSDNMSNDNFMERGRKMAIESTFLKNDENDRTEKEENDLRLEKDDEWIKKK